MNHDAMFKMLLKAPTVLRGFFDAFLPEVARFIDFQAIEFVDKERHTFHARRRTGDLLDWRDFDLPVYPIAVLSHKRCESSTFPGLKRSARRCSTSRPAPTWPAGCTQTLNSLRIYANSRGF